MTVEQLKREVESTLSLGMKDTDSYLTIDYIYGFELFNTQPYHCYETWCGGWRVTDKRNNVVVKREDLGDAILEWKRLIQAKEK